ncbi:MAG: hypothetical protein A2279_01305 [Stygiobacter sp. RIFOXYA12_FULL_38_9]|nr:MAG: hypothetical protein A2279_01305 [Stygiobacter sp. RIFOXYA12_FULL_38_9]OGV09576.1 MAG: hypothetical protein A2299_00550 [Stygiobacter sp. RIFOXYB2_FULL_37_11]OGV15142.1 MAG: hypothetical protein A2237_08940 [Stygiobacter sp. RIFOXYA2_FULL_38_8]OGV16706.1 MAG: hypothetical protein A2440_05020 [Stygiobacter sp. RIFOXYC2_FULL_38_25]OGV82943.1 MAG: hypothetical protein A2X65_13135 [Stygiobacter sp. GWF2_38_21]
MNTKDQIKILWLESGDLYTIRRGIESGKKRGIIVDCVDILDLKQSTENPSCIVFNNITNVVESYDAIIIRTLMPYISEIITIARFFKDAGKVVVDQSLTDEGYALSKMHDYVLLSSSKVDVPRTFQSFDLSEIEKYADTLGFPCILKGIHGSEGRNVFKVDTIQQLRHTLWRYKPGEIMIQEFLPAEYDFRVITVGYKALPVMVRRKPQPGEFRTNFDFKEEVISIKTDDFLDMKYLAEKAAQVLRREFSGVDIRYRNNTPLVLEANRRPGFKGFEEATGYDVAGSFIEYVYDLCLRNNA